MNSKRILICTTTHFPNYDAGSIYYTNIGKCLSDKNDEVLLVGNGFTEYKKIVTNQETGFKYLSLRKAKRSIISKAFSHLLIKKRILNYIYQHANEIDYLILDGSFSDKQYAKIIHFFKQRKLKTKISIGILEKYSLDEFDRKNIMVRRMVRNNNKFISDFNDKDVVLIAISTYLENVFKKRELKCIRIPFIFDETTMITSVQKKEYRKKDKKINFVYAGHPSNKDLLSNILLGFSLLPEEYRKKVVFHIIGVEIDYFLKRGIDKNTVLDLSESVKIYGKMPYDDVEEVYRNIDYSILVRDADKCFSQAGFPTKISESFYHNVVPLTNLTSDLGKYLKDNVNSIIIKDNDPVSISEAIRTATDCYDKIDFMRKEAQTTFEEYFAVGKYKKDLQRAMYNG